MLGPQQLVSSFVVVKQPLSSFLRTPSSRKPPLHVSQNYNSWSGAQDKDSRPSGVRKRVKSLLQKAKRKRRTSKNVVAEAASIGAYTGDLVVGGGGDAYSQELNALQEKAFGRNGTDVELVVAQSGRNDKQEEPDNDNESVRSSNHLEVDTLLNSGTIEPLPFILPQLSEDQLQQLRNGERIQEQSRMGRDGSGYVVLDIPAPDYVVWEALLDFEQYPQYIGTVRDMEMYTNTHLKQSYIAEKPVTPGSLTPRRYGQASITRARFVLSKFKLNIAAVHQYSPHPDGHYMEFSLDKACKNVVLKDAKGIWYTETLDNAQTRVWLLCDLKVSRLLPTFIVDYAAKRAMPRASSWLKPTVLNLKSKFETKTKDAA